MRTKRSQEAYLLISHQNSPGITPEFMRANNLPGPAVGAGEVFESAMVVCAHCHNDVVLNPDRSRDREWCRKCDAYICDDCGLVMKASGEHKSAQQKISEIFEQTQRAIYS
jgi:hypothetical protein